MMKRKKNDEMTVNNENEKQNDEMTANMVNDEEKKTK